MSVTVTPVTTEERWQYLVYQFPTLRRYFGSRGWWTIAAKDVAAFIKSPAATGGSVEAAKFCLAVWHGNGKLTGWRCGTFDIMSALKRWDDEHITVFTTWAKDPFFP
jgi:hypothetical protein